MTNQLIREEKDSLQAKLPVAEVEEVLKGRPEEVQDHGVVVALSTIPPHEGNSNPAGKSLVDLRLIFQLRVLSLDGLELDGDLLAGDDVDSEVNITCKLE
jgi:hypothetical protein